MDCKRRQQAWPLFQLSSTQNGGLWRLHQRALGAFLDSYATESLLGQNQLEGEDFADRC